MPELVDNNVRARCPDCSGAITTFEHKVEGSRLRQIQIETSEVLGRHKVYITYRLLRCAGCGRGGMSKSKHSQDWSQLLDFYPKSVDEALLPDAVPEPITAEFREAEKCLAWGARRAASALFRSALEKTLKANGYQKGSLKKKIDEAANDGILTETRKKRAHEEIRVLGNDVLHDDWRLIDEAEIESTHRYAQRVLEDFYDTRSTVEAQLVKKGRLSELEMSEAQE